MRSYKGLFITFEGGEGAGKSTQIRLLVKWLRKHRVPVLLTLEPGGTKIGKRIRELLLNPKTKNLSQRAELLLYVADRAQHVDEVVLPALRSGKVVVSDRYADSSTVYQGICRNLGVKWTETLNDFATNQLMPDTAIVLDIPETLGLMRVRNRVKTDVKLKGKRRIVKMDRLEREKASFHKRVRQGFLYLSKKHPKRIQVFDARQSQEALSEQICSYVGKRVMKKRLSR